MSTETQHRGAGPSRPLLPLGLAAAILAAGCGATDSAGSPPASDPPAATGSPATAATAAAGAPGSATAPAGDATPPEADARPAPLETPDTPTLVFQGVYTRAQAARGGEEFRTHCIQCHQVAQFALGSLRIDQRYESVGDLFLAMTSLMPMNDPGGLPYETYVAIISHFLEAMEYPEGTRELPVDVNHLLRIRFEPTAE